MFRYYLLKEIGVYIPRDTMTATPPIEIRLVDREYCYDKITETAWLLGSESPDS